jgi:hypothetical protein
VPGNRIFVTDFGGSVYSADLDGKNERNFLSSQGNLTGVAYAESLHTTKTVGLPHARGHGELYDGVA